MPNDNIQSARPSSPWTRSRTLAGGAYLAGITLALLLLGSIAGRATAQIPTAVELVYFRGESGDNVAYLEWETGTEQDTAGFRVERAPSEAGPYSPLDAYEFIVATGSVANGASYEATDETVVNGQTYWYKLVEVTNSNADGDEWTLRLEIEPEPTAQVIDGSGNSDSGTSTLAPTSTTAPGGSTGNGTNTPVAGSSSVTNTPAPTDTPQPTTSSGPETTPTEAIATRIPRATATSSTATEEVTGAPIGSPTVGAPPLAEEESPPTTTPPPVLAEEAASVAEAAVESQADAEGPGNGEETAVLGARTVGSRAEAEVTVEETAAAQEEAESSRLLLWLGFIAAFLIFVGGVTFSIFLSARKRSDDLS